MKNLAILIFTFISFSLAASNTLPHTTTKKIDVKTSTITWTGKKVTGAHTGTITIKDGSLEFDHGKLIGGAFTIDMNTIKCTDLSGNTAAKLEGHLKSDDFFGIPNNPTSTLTITDVKANKSKGAYTVTADMTIKGITKSITFDTNVGTNSATANVVINRTDFDIRYGSGSFYDNLGDKMIYDDFELVLDLKF